MDKAFLYTIVGIVLVCMMAIIPTIIENSNSSKEKNFISFNDGIHNDDGTAYCTTIKIPKNADRKFISDALRIGSNAVLTQGCVNYEFAE